METSSLASMVALPREGHLDAVFHMFAFLKRKHNDVIVFDLTKPEIDINKFPREDWSATPDEECRRLFRRARFGYVTQSLIAMASKLSSRSRCLDRIIFNSSITLTITDRYT